MDLNIDNFPTCLARDSVEHYLRHRIFLNPPAGIPEPFRVQAGVFVTIKKSGSLRGCIGTIWPQHSTVAVEIIRNAVSAATRDPRFSPVSSEEMEFLSYSVDVLGVPEPIESLGDLNPDVYGVIVRSGMKCGLLLPAIEGIGTAADQVRVASQKAGIRTGEPISLERFQVQRFGKK